MDPFRYAGLPDGATLRNVRQGNVVCGYVFLARVKATLGADIYRSFSLSCSISRGQWKESELQLFPGPSAFGAIEFRWSQVHPDSIAGDPTYDNGSFYSCSRPWRYALRARPREHS